MKKLLVVFLMVFVAMSIFAQDTAKNVIDNKNVTQGNLLKQTFAMPNSTVVAVVNGIAITKGDLMYEIWKSSANKILDQMINQKILEEAFLKEKIAVTPSDIDKEKETILAQYRMKDLDELLQKANVSYDDFINELRIQAGLKKFVDKNFTVDKTKFVSYMKPAHILIKFDSSIENEIEREEACKKKIDEIYAKVKAGEDFAALAKEYSEDGSKNNGGSLGWVDPNVNYVPEFKAAMLNLKAGEVSEPVKSQFGYHIIKMEQRGDTASEKELETLITREKNQQSSILIKKWYDKIKNEVIVENFLVPAETKTPEAKPAEEKK
ncbi:MAG: peptidylprolyl isomerase [Armatimonadetes bacterium]|nr:peptidylprolyl isomerase [Candidatus Hippobium faecium]